MRAGIGMTSPGDSGRGLGIKQVIIRSIDPGADRVLATDANGAEIEMPWRVQRVGIAPQVGQTWLVDRALGFWALAALVAEPPPAALAWTDYDPALTGGSTIGDGALHGAYCRDGALCTVRVSLLWGSTTSVSGDITITLPFPAAAVPGASSAPWTWVGSAFAEVASAANRAGVTIVQSGAAEFGVSGEAVGSGWTATVPTAWASGDQMVFEVTYEPV